MRAEVRILTIGAMLALGAPLAAGEPTAPAGEILGVHVGMPQSEVELRLKRIGVPIERKAEREGANLEMKQLWSLKDARFATAIVRLDSGHRLKWITAYAREGGPELRYSDVADTALAQRAGRYIYTWKSSAAEGKPATILTARGTSPERFSSLSLVAAPPPREVSTAPDSSSH